MMKKFVLSLICFLSLLVGSAIGVMAEETFIVGCDLQGQYLSGGNTEEVNAGFFSITGERLFQLNHFFETGYGLAIEGPRSLKSQVGNFLFLPVYGVINVSPFSDRFPLFITARAGYDFWFGDETFKANRNLNGGFYYGGGLGFGFSSQPNSPKLLILYSVNTGSIQTDTVSEVQYSKLSINLLFKYDDFL